MSESFGHKENLGVISMNLLGEINFWSPAMVLLTGIAPMEAAGKTIYDVFPAFQKNQVLNRLRNVIQNGAIEFLSGKFHKDLFSSPFGHDTKSMGSFLFTLAPLKSTHETIVGMIGVLELTASQTTLLSSGLSDVDRSPEKSPENAVSDLIRTLLNQHHNPAILSSVINVMTLSSENLLPFFQELMANPNPDIRIYTLQIIGDRVDRESLPLLLDALHDPDSNVIYHAIEALGKIRAPEAFDPLVSIASGKDLFLASAALFALSNLGAQVAYQALQHLWENEELKSGMIDLAANDAGIDAIKQLCQLMNEDASYAEEVASALGLIHSKFENNTMRLVLFQELLNEFLNERGIQQLIAMAAKEQTKNFKTLVRLLSLLSNLGALQFLVTVMGNPEIQEDVLQGIKRNSDLLFETLIRELEEENEMRVLPAIIALGRIGKREAVPHLTNMFSRSPAIIIHATGALAKIGYRGCYHDLLPLLAHPDALVRRAAVSALNSIAHPDMPADMERLVQSGHLFERESALRIAGYFGYEACLPHVLDALNDPEEFIRLAAIEVLPFFDYPATGKIVGNLYKISGNRFRSQILKSATFMESDDALPLIRQALEESDPWIKTYALRSAGTLNLREVAPQIKQLLTMEGPVFVKITAIQALGDMRMEGAEEEIAAMADGSNFDLALTVVNALGSMGTHAAFNALHQLLQKADNQLKEQIIPVMAGFDQANIVDQLVITASTTQSDQIRQQCVNSLSLSGSAHAYQALLKLLKNKDCKKLATETLLKISKHNEDEIWQFANQRNENKLLLADFLTRSEWPRSLNFIHEFISSNDPLVKATYESILATKYVKVKTGK